MEVVGYGQEGRRDEWGTLALLELCEGRRLVGLMRSTTAVEGSAKGFVRQTGHEFGVFGEGGGRSGGECTNDSCMKSGQLCSVE